LTLAELKDRLRGDGLGIRVGPFDFCVRNTVHRIDETLHLLYGAYPVLEGARVFSAHTALRPVRELRRTGLFAGVRFTVDGLAAHEDMPAHQALAVLEWGLNLVIALRYHRFLMLHSAVVERGGCAMLLPAWPGHGKSTLCAALVHRGWRLLSDEFGLVRPGTTTVVPVPRLVPLKNESIAVIRAFAPEAVLGPEIPNTRKGTVAHLRPPADSIARAVAEAPVRWLVFPRWIAKSSLVLEPMSPAEAFLQVATNAFNYELLATSAFETVRAIIGVSSSFRLQYSNLDDAVFTLTKLADSDVG
jgi:HprK-related kinase A